MDCGSTISAACTGTTIQFNGPNNIKIFVADLVNTGTFAIKLGVATAGQSMTPKMLEAMNALRCAFVSGFQNFQFLLIALYYLAIEFSFLADLQKAVDDYYPYLCTCLNEVDSWGDKLGASIQVMAKFKSCSSVTVGGSADGKENKGDKFACTLDGYTNMTQKIVALSLAVLTMAMTTFEAMLPTNVKLAVQNAYKFLLSSGDWAGFLVSAVFFFAEDQGFGAEVCDASQYGYYAIYYLNYALTFGQGGD